MMQRKWLSHHCKAKAGRRRNRLHVKRSNLLTTPKQKGKSSLWRLVIESLGLVLGLKRIGSALKPESGSLGCRWLWCKRGWAWSYHCPVAQPRISIDIPCFCWHEHMWKPRCNRKTCDFQYWAIIVYVGLGVCIHLGYIIYHVIS